MPTGTYCKKHDQFCTDGVCPWCEPEIKGASAEAIFDAQPPSGEKLMPTLAAVAKEHVPGTFRKMLEVLEKPNPLLEDAPYEGPTTATEVVQQREAARLEREAARLVTLFDSLRPPPSPMPRFMGMPVLADPTMRPEDPPRFVPAPPQVPILPRDDQGFHDVAANCRLEELLPHGARRYSGTWERHIGPLDGCAVCTPPWRVGPAVTPSR